MANRFPLIVDSSSNQIKELEASDNIDLTNSGIVNAQSISATHLNLSGVVPHFLGLIHNSQVGQSPKSSYGIDRTGRLYKS